jgi:sigma-B regulation protein RsbU (phosphoserine phosphatase)
VLYANCGHNPPLVLRRAGGVERLAPTAAVLGILEEWECTTGEVTVGAGDLLAVYTDGVVEAFSDEGEEFGEARFEAALRARIEAPLGAVLSEVVADVVRFSGHEQDDDLTLLLARGR